MKYVQAFDIAKVAVRNMEAQGWRFRDGVVREVALAAVPQEGSEAIADVMMNALYAHRISLNPAWDGSVA